MKVLIIGCCIGSAALIAGCSHKVLPTVISQTKDSVVYKVVPHDTTIYIPGKTVEIEKITPCPEWNFDTVATDGNMRLHVNVTKGQLTASCKTDSLQKVIKLLSTTLERYQFHKDIERVPVEVPKPYIPKWVWWSIVANLVQSAWIFRKPLLTLIKI